MRAEDGCMEPLLLRLEGCARVCVCVRERGTGGPAVVAWWLMAAGGWLMVRAREREVGHWAALGQSSLQHMMPSTYACECGLGPVRHA